MDAATEETPLWLSHHRADEYDRCVLLGGRHVCRRCIVLYPTAIVVGVVLGIAGPWPTELDPWLLWLLPLPSVIEFVLEHRGVIEHSPTRLVAFTIPLAIACARLYQLYLDDAGNDLVWSVVGLYGGICVMAAVFRARAGPRPK
jgi:hypothetical protein